MNNFQITGYYLFLYITHCNNLTTFEQHIIKFHSLNNFFDNYHFF